MSELSHEIAVFLQLARASQLRRRPLIRDRMLILAGVAAAQLQLDLLADYCRSEVLKDNPRHLVGHWPTFAEAIIDDDFLALLRQLRRRYPLEKAERLLDALGIDASTEGRHYANVLEYAAAILDVDTRRFLQDD